MTEIELLNVANEKLAFANRVRDGVEAKIAALREQLAALK